MNKISINPIEETYYISRFSDDCEFLKYCFKEFIGGVLTPRLQMMPINAETDCCFENAYEMIQALIHELERLEDETKRLSLSLNNLSFNVETVMQSGDQCLSEADSISKLTVQLKSTQQLISYLCPDERDMIEAIESFISKANDIESREREVSHYLKEDLSEIIKEINTIDKFHYMPEIKFTY